MKVAAMFLRKILRRAARFGYSYLGQENHLHKIMPNVAEVIRLLP